MRWSPVACPWFLDGVDVIDQGTGEAAQGDVSRFNGLRLGEEEPWTNQGNGANADRTNRSPL